MVLVPCRLVLCALMCIWELPLLATIQGLLQDDISIHCISLYALNVSKLEA